jgi:hypothetical protein
MEWQFCHREGVVDRYLGEFVMVQLDGRSDSICFRQDQLVRLCECGCGREVRSGNRFMNGHNARVMCEEARSKCRQAGLQSTGNKSNLGRRQSVESNRKRSRAALGQSPRVGAGRVKWYDYLRKDGREIRVQGPYELRVCEYLDEIEEEWEYVGQSKTHSFLLSDGSRYYPDFHLPRLSLYLDPKGFLRGGENAKAFRAQREYSRARIVVLLGDTYLEQLQELLGEEPEEWD